MSKRLFIPVLLGAVVYYLSAFIANVGYGFTSRIAMKHVPNESAVYEMLKASLTEPGIYLCNPPPILEGRFPDDEPVFGIRYSGIGHESAGIGEILDLLIVLAALIIVAWMLSVTSDKFLSKYANRVLFVTAVGFLLAVFGDLKHFGIGGYPLSDALILSARTFVTWLLVGLVIAWRLHPRSPSTVEA